MIARFGKARVSLPGGCAIGTRPIDLHQKALEQLGVEIFIEHGYINASGNCLKGNEIRFEKISVGATENALCVAVLSEGTTNIYNAATEPEITALIDFLLKMGANIVGRGTTNLTIKGVSELNPVKMKMIPDRIEAGTFLIAGAITNSDLTISNCNPSHLTALIEKLENCGCKIDIENDSIRIRGSSKIKPVDVTTAVYPGFPTDLQAQFLSLMTLADGNSKITDTIFPDRFMHVAELNRLETDIKVERNTAFIRGREHLSGAEVMATDLRASAALVLAGLAAKGQTSVSRIYHIDRGYLQIEKKLQAVGADITRVLG